LSHELPADRPRPSLKTFKGGRYQWALAPDLLHSSLDFFNLERVSAFRGFCAVLNLLLGCYLGSGDILISSPVATPRPAGAENLIGLFVNTVIFRARFSGRDNFQQILAQVNRTVKDAIAHGALEFDRIIEALNPPRDVGRTPLVRVNFRVRKTPYPALALPGIQGSRAEYVDTRTSKFDLALEIEATEGMSYFEYSTELFDKATIIQMARDLQALLRAVIARPTLPVKDLESVREIQQRPIKRRFVA
jgi:non-ribosomal peptide synthetase component F